MNMDYSKAFELLNQDTEKEWELEKYLRLSKSIKKRARIESE